MRIARVWFGGMVIFLLVALQVGLAPFLSNFLARALAKEAKKFTSLQVKIAPLTWYDLFIGRLRRVEVRATRISFDGPEFSSLYMDLTQVKLSYRRLFRHEAAISSLGPSRITARIEEKALNEYYQRNHPGFPLNFSLSPQKIIVTGRIVIFGRLFTFSAAGRLTVVEGRVIRYLPVELEAGGRRLPTPWLEVLATRLALEFPLAIPLPVSLQELRLGRGYIVLSWREATQKVSSFPSRPKNRNSKFP